LRRWDTESKNDDRRREYGFSGKGGYAFPSFVVLELYIDSNIQDLTVYIFCDIMPTIRGTETGIGDYAKTMQYLFAKSVFQDLYIMTDEMKLQQAQKVFETLCRNPDEHEWHYEKDE